GNGIANIATTGWNQRLYAAYTATTGTYNTGCANLGFDVVSIVPCVTPHAGNAVSSVSVACASQNFTLSLANDSVNAGLSYQWLSSPSGMPGTFLPMTNDTNRIFQKSQTNTNWYSCVVTCGTTSDTSTIVQVITDPTPLSGTYTVDTSSIVSATNFHSLADLVSALNCRGITGPITINVASGLNLNQNIVFGNIPGISATNTVTINGNGSTVSSAASPVISFNNARFITLDSLNVTLTGATGFGIHLGGQSQFITIRNATINVGTSSTATTNAGIVVSGSTTSATTAGNNAQNVIIENNTINGGYYSIVMFGNASYLSNTGHIIRNNKLLNQYYYGVYLSNADTILVENNEITRDAGRASVASIYYGIYVVTGRNIQLIGNIIHSSGPSASSTYGIAFSTSVNSQGFESKIINNQIYNIGTTTGLVYGIYTLGTVDRMQFYHNTVDLNTSSTGVRRGLFFSTAPNNFQVRNNIVSLSGNNTGAKFCIYVTTTSASFVSNNNVYHMGATAGTNNLGYWTANRATLADWRTASGQDSASVDFNPVFANASLGNLTPLSMNCDNIGANVGVNEDALGFLRSLTTPDAGAIEFTGTSGDIAITNASLKRSSVCYSTNDSLFITIQNTIGSSIDFSVDPLSIAYEVNGPINTTDSIIVFSGTLAMGASINLSLNTINMSVPGIYNLSAYIRPNAVNNSTTNDTLLNISSVEVKPMLAITPRYTVVNSPLDTVKLTANSPLFSSGEVKFTEICHWRLATGAAPTAGWPAYMLADDYVELMGVPNSDLAGYTMEEWTGTTLQHTVTFPTGTLFSPNGTMILATGQLGSSVPSPTNFYYHTGNTVTHSSTGDIRGYIIKNSSGAIVDAVAFGAYTFPPLSGVTSSDWTGATSNVSSAGIRLTGPDVNSATNWVVESATGRQDPNIPNTGVPQPSPASMAGFNWYFLGSPIDTMPSIVVGPYTIPDTYQYIAIFTNQCGTFTDTGTVVASSTVPVQLVDLRANKTQNDIAVIWTTASEVNNDYFEVQRSVNGRDFESIGNVKGKGTTSAKSTYRFMDADAVNMFKQNRNLYYRLKQVDFDGSFEWSKIVSVELSSSTINQVLVAPNPNDGKFIINITTSEESQSNIRIVDVVGSEVYNNKENLLHGINKIDINTVLPKGIYFIQIENNGQTSTQKIVVQ
ncbi:MAG: T9SS type A sorting domain-containing protein, partial [Bacteroidota bacterium]|nr:T9SS type A sorting domain-containing protein [Bacteroidota bacterium]